MAKRAGIPILRAKSNEIGVKIGAITCAKVTSVNRVTSTPAGPRFVVTHSTDHVVVERFRAFEVVVFSSRRFLSKRPEGFVNRHQFFRAQVTRSFCTIGGVGCLFLAHTRYRSSIVLPLSSGWG